MYQLLDFRKWLELFAPLVSTLAIIIWTIRRPSEPLAYLECIEQAGLIAVLTVVAIGETPIFHALWRKPLIQKWLFPYIAGRYEGVISSNWSVIAQMRKAATGTGGLANADLHVDSLGAFEKPVTVEIKASLFRVSMKLIPHDRYTDSQTVWLRPVREEEAGHPRLYYMYKSFAQVPKSTDVQQHFGAAYADVIDVGEKLALRGSYWTERNWARGENTAGALNVTKV